MFVHGKGNEGRVRPRRVLYDDMQHTNIPESSCNVLDLAISQSPRATAFTAVDGHGLSGMLLVVSGVRKGTVR
jgi:hypothetical protein